MVDSLPTKMAIGATGGMGAAMFCHPLDVLRVNMQVQAGAKSTMTTFAELVKCNGVFAGLYSGISAAFLRQWTYGACRLGIYTSLLSSSGKPANQVGFGQKLMFGVLSGGIGSWVGTPAELALVRMSADAAKPVAERRGGNVALVLQSVVRDTGFVGMWRGALPTVTRAMALAGTTLSVTSETKDRLPKLVPQLAAYPTVTMGSATIVASFWATVVSQPFDVIKSRIQNTSANPGGVALYSGTMDCLVKTVREGPLALFKGFTPAFIKLAPYNLLSLTIVEKLTLMITGRAAF